MKEPDELTERDKARLEKLEVLLAAPDSSQNGTTGSSDVVTLLANTVPQADNAFRQQLDAQLIEKLERKQAQRRRQEQSITARTSKQSIILKHPTAVPHWPFGRITSRLSSALAAVTLLAVLALALVFLLQSASIVSQPGGNGTSTALTTTPAVLATQAGTSLPLNLEPAITITASLIHSNSISWSPDGRSLASASPDGAITLWDPATGHKQREITTSTGGKLDGIEWSPDGSILAARFVDEQTFWGIVVLLDAATGKQLNSFTLKQGSIKSMAWSPDSRILAWTDGWTITLWDKVTSSPLPKPQPTWPAPITTPEIEPNIVRNLAWSPDSKQLATSQQQVIKMWEPTTGQQISSFINTDMVAYIAWSQDGSKIACVTTDQIGATNAVVVWDAVNGKPLNALKVAGLVRSIAWQSGPDILALSTQDEKYNKHTITLYYTAAGKIALELDANAGDLAWSPDGKMLAVADDRNSTLTLWSNRANPSRTSPVPHSDTSPTARSVTPASTIAPHPRPAGDCRPGWTVTQFPSTKTNNSNVRAIAAISASDVWAVGEAGTSGEYANTLTLHWDGTSWKVVPSPNIKSGTGFQGLTAIAAVTANDVWAVGDYTDSNAAPHETFIQHWDGRAWSIVPSPSPGELNTLTGLSVISSNDVWAVGMFSNGSTQQTLTIHWDGSKWSIVPTPNAGNMSSLAGVTAVSANDVWAVGEYYGDVIGESPGMPLTMHWDGKQWSIVSSIDANGAPLSGVAAIASDDVWAVGSRTVKDKTTMLALHWDGKQWNNMPVPEISNYDSLSAVAATSSKDVWAVGTQVLHWDGKNWAEVPSPNTKHLDPTGTYVALTKVAASAGGVWALGTDTATKPFMMRYGGAPCPTRTPLLDTTNTPSGTKVSATNKSGSIVTPKPTEDCVPGWSTVILPATGADNSYFGAMVSVSANDIWAVGSTEKTGNSSNTLTVHWDGVDWTIVPSPNKGDAPSYNSLHGIAAATSDDIWAVGNYTKVGGVPHETLILRWNGNAWAIVPSPSPGKYNVLVSVTAVSPQNVWAVGNTIDNNGKEQMLIEHWDGVNWSVVPAPKVGKVSSTLMSMAAISADDIWAVGWYRDEVPSTPTRGLPLIMHWNGKQWSMVPTPDVGNAQLSGVTSIGPNDAWTVGSRQVAENNDEVLVLHWDGTKWSMVSMPKFSSYTDLYSISALSTSDAWVAGRQILHWDGKTWTEVHIPVNISDNTHYNIVASPGGDLWVNATQSIMLYYRNSPCATPTVSTPKKP